MGRVFKYLGWLIGLLVLFIVAAVVVLPRVVDPNDFKDQIVARVEQETGRTLKIGGDLKLSVFPWLGIKTGDVEMGNARGFGPQPFASVHEASVRVKLMPLFRRKLEVDTVTLKGLQLNLGKTRDGRSNWADLEQRFASTEKKAPEAGGQEGAGPGLTSMAIGGVDITNARVTWDDRQQGKHMVIDRLNLESSAYLPGRPLDLKLRFAFESEDPPLSSEVNLDGQVTVDQAQEQIDIAGLGLKVVLEDGELPGGRLQLAMKVDGRVAAETWHLELRGVELRDDNIRLTAEANLDRLAQQLEVKGLQLQLVAEKGMLPTEKAVLLDLSGDIQYATDSERLLVSGLLLRSGDLQISGEVQGEGFSTVPELNGRLAVAELDLRTWLEQLGVTLPEMADAGTLRRFSADATFNTKGDTTRIDPLAVTLDDSRLKGSVQMAGEAVAFDLDLDAIDLDRYLPPPPTEAKGGKTGAQEVPSKGAQASSEELIPVETLRKLNLDGRFRAGRVKVMKLLAEAIELTVKAKGGQLSLGKKVGRFYQGNFLGTLGLDVRGKAPSIALDTKARQIAIGPLLKDLTGEDRLTGTGRFDARLDTRGNSVDAFKAALNGKLGLRFENGAVNGFNLARTIREAKARFKGKPLPPDDRPLKTDFSEISATAVVKKGILDNRDFLAKSPYLRVTGKGQVNLVSETLDYTVKAVIVKTAKGAGGKDLDELTGIPIPIHLTGPYQKPKLEIQWAEVLVAAQKADLGEKAKKYQGKLEKKKEKLQHKLEKKLFKLFD